MGYKEKFKTFLFGVGFAILLFGVSLAVLPQLAEAGEATLKIDPPQGTFYVGSSFDVSIVLDTGGETINAVETELRFPQNTLQVTSPSAARSFVAIWTSPPSYSNQDGYVRFQGGIPSPGLKTSQGVLSTISFRATQPGTVTLELRDSRVLLADGSGTNIFSRAFGARYTIAIPPPQGPTVSSITHPEFTKWYRDKFVAFSWNKEEKVTDFSWSLDQNPNGIPDVESEGGETSVSYKDLEDGIWYFHIRAKQGDVWGGVTTFAVKIDTESPAQFPVELDPKNTVTVKTRVSAVYRTTDRLSGIGRYEVNIVNVSGPGETHGSTFFVEGESPYRLPELSVGVYSVIVRAYDLAGNFQESSATLEIRESTFAPFLTEGLRVGARVIRWSFMIVPLLIVTIIITFAAARFWKRHRHVRKETKKGIESLRERLKGELDTVQNKVSEDVELRERLAEQIKRFSELSTSLSKEKDNRRRGGVFTGGFKLLWFLVVVSPILMSFFVPAVARAQEFSADVPPPKILTYQVEVASNQLLYLTGIAPSGSIVLVYIAGEGQETIRAEAIANEEGHWEHLHNLYLHPGFYRLWAEAIGPTGVKSEASLPLGFRVSSRLAGEGASPLGRETIFGVIAVSLIVLNAGLVGYLVYGWYISARQRKKMQQEVKEIHDALRIGFTLIKRELQEDLLLLERDLRAKGGTLLLEKERKIKKSLMEDITHIEESIQKEVSDVRRIL